MPSLPAANLTLHVDASDTDHLWKTFVSGGPNTGVPVNGDTVSVWEDELIANLILDQEGAVVRPTWANPGPMLLPSLDFSTPANNTRLAAATQTDVPLTWGSFINNNAKTVLIAFRAVSITTAGGASYANDALIMDAGEYFGITLYESGGTYYITAFNYPGTSTYVSTPLTVGANHVVMVRHEAGTLYLAVDGGAEVSVVSGNTSNLAFRVRVGSDAAQFDGFIGEVAIYQTALTGANLTDATAYFVNKWVTPAAPTNHRVTQQGAEVGQQQNTGRVTQAGAEAMQLQNLVRTTQTGAEVGQQLWSVRATQIGCEILRARIVSCEMPILCTDLQTDCGDQMPLPASSGGGAMCADQMALPADSGGGTGEP